MHSYLRAIGFSKIESRKAFEDILNDVMESPTFKYTYEISPNHILVQFIKEFGDNIGISLVGEYDEKGKFFLNYYTPFASAQVASSKEPVMINKRVDTDAYTGMCDDMRLGISLIFYLQNIIDYKKCSDKSETKHPVDIYLYALSAEGKVLLGLSNEYTFSRKKILENHRKNKLIADAKNGNQEAIDALTMEELDTFAMVTRRSRTEDIYTLVEHSFIPFGSESDNYTLLGTILNWDTIKNDATGEEIYCLLINCNHLVFPVYINKNDLFGVPMIGRRFKGNVWMQGNIDFNTL